MLYRVNIVIVEPSVIIRKGIIAVLERLNNLKISIMELGDIESNLVKIINFEPNIIISNPLYINAALIKQIRNEEGCSEAKVIALFTSLADSSIVKSYNGAINIYDGVDKIKEVIIDTIKYEDEEPAKNILSLREKEIIVCVVKGMTNKQIADYLTLSTHTIITHRRNIASKLQIHSSAGLTIYAIVNNLVDMQEISQTIDN